MRTTDAASTDVANQEQPPPAQRDTLFRDSSNRLVEPPVFFAGARFADTHTHLDMLHHPDLALARCAAHAVDFLVTVVDPTEDPRYTYDKLGAWQQAARAQLDAWGMNSCQLPQIQIIIGCHPHNASAYDSGVEDLLIELAQQSITAAVGEIGLDYHYDNSPRDVQQQVFREQIRLAHRLDLPICLHLREAHGEGLAILKQEGLPAAGALLHCFNLDYDTLEPFLELGCKVAFGGPLTFKKSEDVRQAAARTQWDRIMTETDAPFMAPHPLRGTICGPEYVIFTAAKLAEVYSLQGQDAVDFYQQIFANAVTFFSRT
ncbi:MAG: TatD family hydrolase [Coriobacteriaceae bacterium]|nr:TatD family hydrolase [Coriobacteriaceae bacterium]